jgi:hypothetical protein
MDLHGTGRYTSALPTDSKVQNGACNTEPTWLLSGYINWSVSYIETLQLISANTLEPVGLLGDIVVRMSPRFSPFGKSLTRFYPVEKWEYV